MNNYSDFMVIIQPAWSGRRGCTVPGAYPAGRARQDSTTGPFGARTLRMPGLFFAGFSRRFLEVALSLLDMLPVMQQFGEGFHRERLAAKVALADVAALVTQVPELFAGFDALGDDLDVERVGHDDDGAHDARAIEVVGDVLHEAAIDFQEIDRETLEVTQRRIAR